MLKLAERMVSRFAGPKIKGYLELIYWRHRHKREGKLRNGHYEYFYTKAFGFTHDTYENKRVLDVGCGPRGSLEWADMAAERFGLDPLADQYLKLGAKEHRMSYVAAPSENMPFSDGYFDIVTSFNSLDHVHDLAKTIREIKRVVKPDGMFLLIVEINHEPTPLEPITLQRDLPKRFAPEFALWRSWECKLPAVGHDIYGGVREDQRPRTQEESAILCAHFSRTSGVGA
jgi:SAM-dependent methyltransferase